MKTEDLQVLATISHDQTAVAIRDRLREGNADDATAILRSWSGRLHHMLETLLDTGGGLQRSQL